MVMVCTMKTIRRADSRGGGNHGWLDTKHTFSFADYYDPKHMGFRALRVINEDKVKAGKGFGTHGHRDMEILSYVLDGALEHRDTIGQGGVIRHGDVQRMSAGTGVMHSEFNGSKTEPVHFLQIWIMPDKNGVEPTYEQRNIGDITKGLKLIASPDGADGSMKMNADARIYASILGKGEKRDFNPGKTRHIYVHVARGNVKVGDDELHSGDGIALSQVEGVTLEGIDTAEVILFDLA